MQKYLIPTQNPDPKTQNFLVNFLILTIFNQKLKKLLDKFFLLNFIIVNEIIKRLYNILSLKVLIILKTVN